MPDRLYEVKSVVQMIWNCKTFGNHDKSWTVATAIQPSVGVVLTNSVDRILRSVRREQRVQLSVVNHSLLTPLPRMALYLFKQELVCLSVWSTAVKQPQNSV